MNPIKTSARDFFLHLGVIVTLYVSAVSLLRLLFEIINISFPDQLAYQYYGNPYSTGIRMAIASLLIMFPLYLILTWLLNRDYARVPEKRELWIRKWLIYITLFVAGLTLAIDLIILIHYFLGGEITTRFALKVLAVLMVAIGIFTYYLFDVRRSTGVSTGARRSSAVAAIIVVLASMVAGFMIMGSPFTVRLIRLDEQKVNDLTNIQWQIIRHWQSKGTLPNNLSELTDSISGTVTPVDAQTGAAYEYRVIANQQFELCATFNRPNSTKLSNSTTRPIDKMSPDGENWQHGAGRTCFARTIDPELYPVTPRKV
jgi:hypothetical protein